MNVVFFNDNAHVNGGAAKLAVTEAVGLADHGHQVFFVCAVPPIAHELLHPKISVVCSEQPDVLANPNRLLAIAQGWWNEKSYRLVSQLLSGLPLGDTVIHIHTWARALSSSVLCAALSTKHPAVCTLHDFLLACPTGTFFHHGQQTICSRRPLSLACLSTNCDSRSYQQKLWRIGRHLIQKQVGDPSSLTHYIAHSSLAHDVMRPYLPQHAKVHALKMYIDTQRAAPANPEANREFVYLGRIVREKGVLMLARCAAAEHIPLTYIGSGPLEEEVKATYPEAVITGWCDQAMSTVYLRGARALIFPSLWYETFGLVVMEAAANGIPSLVPSTSAAKDLVIDQVTGLHFQAGDEQDLRKQMNRLRDPELVAGLGRAAYERFWSGEYASLTTHIRALESIYHSMLSEDAVAPYKQPGWQQMGIPSVRE